MATVLERFASSSRRPLPQIEYIDFCRTVLTCLLEPFEVLKIGLIHRILLIQNLGAAIEVGGLLVQTEVFVDDAQVVVEAG